VWRRIAGRIIGVIGSGIRAAVALLLDMDGVLVNSTDSVEQDWVLWADRRALDHRDVLALGHGAPSRDVVARFVPTEEVAVEAAWVENLALLRAHEMALPGALHALSQLLLPVAVVTSATRDVARRRLANAGLPIPRVLVTVDEVVRGKPGPDGYMLAAESLGVAITECIGVDDSPAGLASIVAAGAFPIALSTTYDASDLIAASVVLESLAMLRITSAAVTW
jgi:sugar-phosphatase